MTHLATGALSSRLHNLAAWRGALSRELGSLQRFLAEAELAGDAETDPLEALRRRLGSDTLVLAFVAEFSRGKTELVNALFFADQGRRVLPATPGRTTMCPVELRHDAGHGAGLWLLPVQTRLSGRTLAELRGRPEAWQHVAVDPADPASLERAFRAVAQTRRVDLEQARALGFWNDEDPADNPPADAQGLVEVPAWRHALIRHPHPLLRRGLVVLDTPGLNAIGAEPELTLATLAEADAIVFVLGADAGVTRSDLSIWREHLAGPLTERFVVLNKIDTLADPLASAEQVQQAVAQQCALAATTLGVPAARVFGLSAREALRARIEQDARALQASRLPAFEAALAAELLPRQRQGLRAAVEQLAQGIEAAAAGRLAARRRQVDDQLAELRGLRGKSDARVAQLVQRAESETQDIERCTARLAALRAVQMRQSSALLEELSAEALRADMAALDEALSATPLPALGAGRAFAALCERLRARLDATARALHELHALLQGSFGALNAEFGFAFQASEPPSTDAARAALAQLERGYGASFTLGQAWRFAAPGHADRLRRMLSAQLRRVLETLAGEVELWGRRATAQLEQQLGERRRELKRRLEALQRIRSAAGELEARIEELERHAAQLAEHGLRLVQRLQLLREMLAAGERPGEAPLLAGEITLRLDVGEPPSPAADTRPGSL